MFSFCSNVNCRLNPSACGISRSLQVSGSEGGWLLWNRYGRQWGGKLLGRPNGDGVVRRTAVDRGASRAIKKERPPSQLFAARAALCFGTPRIHEWMLCWINPRLTLPRA